MVSDQEIASCVESLLRQEIFSPVATVDGVASLNGVVRHVEAKLGIDLSHKTTFIRDQIELLLGPRRPPATLKDQHAVHQTQLSHLQRYRVPPVNSASHALHSHHQIPHLSPFSHLAPHHEFAFGNAQHEGQSVIVPSMATAAAQHLIQKQQHPQVATVGVPPVVSNSKESAPAVAKRKGCPGGLNKVCGVSPELQTIVGEPALARTQIVKQLWAYIRKNNLQDPNNKRKIICNDELRRVFETDSTDMFKMNKLLAKHIIPLEPAKDSCAETKRVKVEDAAKADLEAGSPPMAISAALAHFFSTDETEMVQSVAMRRIWDYITHNKLQDPADSSRVLSDSMLMQLFGSETFFASGIPEMLSYHLSKKS